MDSRKRFLGLETMCRERAQLAKGEFEYWLSEADEWALYKNSTDPSIESIPTQLDWCVESPSKSKLHRQTRNSPYARLQARDNGAR